MYSKVRKVRNWAKLFVWICAMGGMALGALALGAALGFGIIYVFAPDYVLALWRCIWNPYCQIGFGGSGRDSVLFFTGILAGLLVISIARQVLMSDARTR
jgi:hypothetical protein